VVTLIGSSLPHRLGVASQRDAVLQSKIALRLVKTLEVAKVQMFEAMASYDWETVLRCLDAGLGANDEALNGQSVMTFASERAAYVTYGFLKSLYGPTYRPPKLHSTRRVPCLTYAQ
jgi:hypothetical protein